LPAADLVSHMAPLEKPADVAAALEKFFAS
jgi:hypothetical protein